jgi:hypothetical protein
MRKKSTLKLKATAVLNSRPQRRLGPIRSPRIVQRSCRLSSHLRRVRSVAATSEQRLVSSSLVPHRTSRKSARRSKIESIGFSFESFSGYTRKHEQAQLAAKAGEGSTEEVGTGVANKRNKVPSIGQSTTGWRPPVRCGANNCSCSPNDANSSHREALRSLSRKRSSRPSWHMRAILAKQLRSARHRGLIGCTNLN